MKSVEKLYNEYVDRHNEKGSISLTELRAIRSETELIRNRLEDTVKSIIENIIPMEVYYQSDALTEEKSDIVQELKDFVMEGEDIDHNIFPEKITKLINERLFNRLNHEQKKEVRGTLFDIASFSDSITELYCRKSALDLFIRRVVEQVDLSEMSHYRSNIGSINKQSEIAQKFSIPGRNKEAKRMMEKGEKNKPIKEEIIKTAKEIIEEGGEGLKPFLTESGDANTHLYNHPKMRKFDSGIKKNGNKRRWIREWVKNQ